MTERICGRCGNEIGRAEPWGIRDGIVFHQVCPAVDSPDADAERERVRELVERRVREELHHRSKGVELLGVTAAPDVLTLSFRGKRGRLDVPIRFPDWHTWSVAHLAEEAILRVLFLLRPTADDPAPK